MSDRLSDISASATSWAVATLGAGVVWLIRRVLTNQAQIEMMRTELRHRDELRAADRATTKELRDEMRELRKDIRQIFERSAS